MDMNRGQSKMNGANDEKGSGHGMAKVAGKQSLLNKAAAGKHSRQMIRPAQVLKQQLQTIRPVQALKNSCRRSGRYRPRSKTTSR